MAKCIVLNVSGTGIDAGNGVPSGATAGVSLWTTTHYKNTGLYRGTERAILLLAAASDAATAGSLTVKLWGFDGTSWYPFGTNTDSTLKGVINEGTALAETATDLITHSEVVTGLTAFKRIYAQVVSVANIASLTISLDAPLGAVRAFG